MWVNHHSMFRQIQRADRGLMFLNLGLLLWTALLPVPDQPVRRVPAGRLVRRACRGGRLQHQPHPGRDRLQQIWWYVLRNHLVDHDLNRSQRPQIRTAVLGGHGALRRRDRAVLHLRAVDLAGAVPARRVLRLRAAQDPRPTRGLITRARHHELHHEPGRAGHRLSMATPVAGTCPAGVRGCARWRGGVRPDL